MTQTDWQMLDFAHGGVDYDYYSYCANSDSTALCNCNNLVCTALKIDVEDATIESIDERVLAETILQAAEQYAQSQKDDIEKFLKRKAGQGNKNQPAASVYDAYIREQEKENNRIKEENKTLPSYQQKKLTKILSYEEMNFSYEEADITEVESILRQAQLDADDFNIEIDTGYYGDEISGVFLANEAKIDQINGAISKYFASNN